EAEQELRVAEKAAVQAVALPEARIASRPAPPLERDHVQAWKTRGSAALVDGMPLEQGDRLPRPGHRGAGGRLGPPNLGLRLQHRMPLLEERVRVRDAVVRAGEEAQDRLATLQVRELEPQAVDLEPIARGHQLGTVILVLAGARAPGQPEPVVSLLGGPER